MGVLNRTITDTFVLKDEVSGPAGKMATAVMDLAQNIQIVKAALSTAAVGGGATAGLQQLAAVTTEAATAAQRLQTIATSTASALTQITAATVGAKQALVDLTAQQEKLSKIKGKSGFAVGRYDEHIVKMLQRQSAQGQKASEKAAIANYQEFIALGERRRMADAVRARTFADQWTKIDTAPAKKELILLNEAKQALVAKAKAAAQATREAERLAKATQSSTLSLRSGVNALLQYGATFYILRAAITGVLDSYQRLITLGADYERAQANLSITAQAFNVDLKDAQTFAQQYSSGGLIPLTDSISSLNNVMKTGLNFEQATAALELFKFRAITGKRSALSLGEAVNNLSQSFLTGRSALAEYSGIQENWGDYLLPKGKEALGLMGQELTTEQERLAMFYALLETSSKYFNENIDNLNNMSLQLDAYNGYVYESKKATGEALIKSGDWGAMLAVLAGLLSFAMTMVEAFTGAIGALTGHSPQVIGLLTTLVGFGALVFIFAKVVIAVRKVWQELKTLTIIRKVMEGMAAGGPAGIAAGVAMGVAALGGFALVETMISQSIADADARMTEAMDKQMKSLNEYVDKIPRIQQSIKDTINGQISVEQPVKVQAQIKVDDRENLVGQVQKELVQPVAGAIAEVQNRQRSAILASKETLTRYGLTLRSSIPTVMG